MAKKIIIIHCSVFPVVRKCTYNPRENMCTHITWDISTYQKVSKITSLLKSLFISKKWFNSSQFRYCLRNYWKQIVLRGEPRKKSALIPFSGPLAQLSCLYHMKRTVFMRQCPKSIPSASKQANLVFLDTETKK